MPEKIPLRLFCETIKQLGVLTNNMVKQETAGFRTPNDPVGVKGDMYHITNAMHINDRIGWVFLNKFTFNI